MGMYDPRWDLATNYHATRPDGPGDDGREPPPQRPYRSLAVALGSVFGLFCGLVLAVYLSFSAGPLRGPFGAMVGLVAGGGTGSALGIVVLLKLANRLGRRNNALKR